MVLAVKADTGEPYMLKSFGNHLKLLTGQISTYEMSPPHRRSSEKLFFIARFSLSSIMTEDMNADKNTVVGVNNISLRSAEGFLMGSN